MIELKDKRSYTAKHFEDGDKFVMHAHIGHQHYFNKLGVGDGEKRFRGIDWTLNWNEVKRGWGFEFHSFHPFLPEYADEWVEFRDLYQDKDQTIRYKAQCEHIKGRVLTADETLEITGQSHLNSVIYDNAFGEGIDYILYFTRSQLVKAVRIREKKSEDTTFDFEVEFPKDVFRGKKKEKYQLDISKDKKFDTNKLTLIGDDVDNGKEWFTYLRGFKVWDSKKSKTIEVDYFLKDGKKYLRKIVPKEFLDNSVGDVFTDTTTNYYVGAGDGRVYDYNSTWNTVHDSTDGDGASDDDTTISVECDFQTPNYWIIRGFLPTDTSGLPDGATISAAVFKLYVNSYNDADGDTEYALVQTSQANTAELVTEDFDECGAVDNPDLGSDEVGDPATGQYVDWTLNATGRGWIDDTGVTKLGMRANHDYDDAAPSTKFNNVNVRLSEYANTGSDPYLAVTYTEVTGPAGVKTVQGLAVASVKTMNGTAIASVKTINGSAA